MTEQQKTARGNDKTAYFVCVGTIDGKLVENVTAALSDLPDAIETLYFLINTSGGTVSHGFALYNILCGLDYRVIMHNIGNVDSIGNVVFMAGQRRYACANAAFLLHPVQGQLSEQSATAPYLLEKLATMESDEYRIRKVLENHTRIPQDELKAVFIKGEVKDVAYALTTGMIDEMRDVSLPKGASVFVIASAP